MVKRGTSWCLTRSIRGPVAIPAQSRLLFDQPLTILTMKIKFLTYNNADEPVWHYAEAEIHGETATCIEDENTLVLYNCSGIWVNFTGYGYPKSMQDRVEYLKHISPETQLNERIEACIMLKIIERLAKELDSTELMARVADAKERKAKALEAESIAKREADIAAREKSRELALQKLSSTREKFLSCKGISGDDFVELCKSESVSLRPNTISSFRKFQSIRKVEGINSVSFSAPRSVKLSDAMFNTILDLFNQLSK